MAGDQNIFDPVQFFFTIVTALIIANSLLIRSYLTSNAIWNIAESYLFLYMSVTEEKEMEELGDCNKSGILRSNRMNSFINVSPESNDKW